MGAAVTTIEAKPNGGEVRTASDFFAFTEAELKAIREVYAPKATDAQFKVFTMEAQRRRLMPGRQLFFRLQRQREYDPELRERVWTEKPIHITGIDAFRLIAQRTGKYAGQKPIVWIYLVNSQEVKRGETAKFQESLVPLPGGVAPYAARATVLRKDFAEPLEVVARWDAYVQTYKDNDEWKPNAMWSRMGPEQLAKCCEALALRKAFPEDLWGLYIHEEFSDDGDDAVVPSAPQLIPPSVAQAPAPASNAPATIEREATSSPAAAETPQPQAQPVPPVGDTAPTSPAAPPHSENPLPKPNGATPKDVQRRFGGQIVRPESESGKKGGIWYLRNVLDKQGVKEGGELMKQYILLATGETSTAKIKDVQWKTVLSVLDGALRKDGPAGVVRLMQETVARGKS